MSWWHVWVQGIGQGGCIHGNFLIVSTDFQFCRGCIGTHCCLRSFAGQAASPFPDQPGRGDGGEEEFQFRASVKWSGRPGPVVRARGSLSHATASNTGRQGENSPWMPTEMADGERWGRRAGGNRSFGTGRRIQRQLWAVRRVDFACYSPSEVECSASWVWSFGALPTGASSCS